MLKMKLLHKILFVVLLTTGCAGTKVSVGDRPASWAEKINTTGLSNLYKVDSNVYRSEQPNEKEMFAISALGIKTVLNLRHIRRDNRKAKKTDLILKSVPMNTWTISYNDLVAAMKAIETSEKPMLVHCLHGSDRTGCIVAVHRMVNCGWTKEEAIKEFSQGGFGYHEIWFPNILLLLKSLDIEQLKKDIQKK